MRKSIVALVVSGLVCPPLVAADAPVTSLRARQTMAAFGQCVAKASPAKTHDVLTEDFRTPAYRMGLRALAENNRDCLAIRGKMRATGLPFAAALAEAMLKSDASPLGTRIARSAGKKAETYAPSDAIAMCVARSAPDDVAALFATGIGSTEETKSAAGLAPVAGMCGKKVGATLEVEPFSLRSILATASFRLVSAQ